MRVLAVIPARSGSKGVKDKNIMPVNGKPLLVYAVEAAVQCAEVTATYISTDSPVYEKIAVEAGAQSAGLRLESLSSDTAKTVDVLIDLVKTLERENKHFDYLVLLQPTSPVRKPEDISQMIRKLNAHPEASGIVSVSRLIEPHPYKLKKITPEGYLHNFLEGTSSELPRQQLPPVYKLNGAIYIVKTAFMVKEQKLFDAFTLPYEMEEGVNIDSAADVEYLNFLLSTSRIRL